MRTPKNSRSYPRREGQPLVLEEAVVAYTAGNYFDFIRLSRNGILKKSLLQLAEKLAFSIHELAKILHISERTLQRYHDDDTLAADASEKTILLAQLYKKGITVFGSPANFNDWMRTPHPVFNNQQPVDLLDTSFGFQLILDELGRIEHGVFA